MANLQPGDMIDQRYQMGRLIGSGGMASVYEVLDTTSGHRAAVKILHRQFMLDPVIGQRFIREAQAASVLDTPYSVKVEGTGNLSDGRPFIVMELLEGLTLQALIERQGPRFEAERVLYLADQVALGLIDAHARGIIHRDLKPDNIFVINTPAGELIKIVDYGISKIFSGEGGVKLTQTGVTVGTPQYMPVEQLRGTKNIDGRVDVYALGVVLYEMLAGQKPYDGFTYEEVILKVATTTAPSLGVYRSDLPEGLVSLVDRAMARQVQDRIASMTQLRQEMAPYWSGRYPLSGSGQSLAQSGAFVSARSPELASVSPRASAGHTQVLQGPAAALAPPVPAPPPELAAPSPPVPAPQPELPAKTLPDHVYQASRQEPVSAAPPMVETRQKSSSTIVILLVIIAVFLFLLLVGIGVLALMLLG